MSVAAAKRRYDGLRNTIGKAALNAVFPKDFEYYLVSFELVNSKGFTEEFFIFPVNPTSIKQTDSYLTNIRKANTGVTITKTDSFIPKDITISGTFGHQFKLITNRNAITFAGIALTAVSGGAEGLVDNFVNQSGADIVSSVFNREVKTGYGCLKLLESILNKAQQKDPYGLPYRLLFYNPSLGNNYIVEPLTFEQDGQSDRNFILNYTLQMKAVAPLNQIGDLNEFNLVNRLNKENILNRGNRLASRLGRILSNG